ncbi:MAG: hypothetical protein WCK58_17810 [Chloroflexota bacterium]
MSGEAVIGIIPAARIKTGMFSSKTYTLVFTSVRLLLAEARKELVTAEIERARAEAKAGGSGFMGQWGAQLKTSGRFGQHYLGADPAAIIAETPGNGALTPADVRSIRIERKSRNAGSDDDFEQDYLRITIETGSAKHTFETDGEQPKADEARRLAASVFGGAVK